MNKENNKKAKTQTVTSFPFRMPYVLFGICLVVVIGWAGMTLLQPSPEAVPPPPGAMAPVAVVSAQVTLAEFADPIEAIGTAKARESVMITAQVTDIAGQTLFSDGDVVEAGDILVALVDSEENAELAEARANLDEALKQHARLAELVKRGNATQSNLDRQTAVRDTARARLDVLSARLSDRLIRAPFSGVLGMRLISPGALLEPGDPIATLDDIRVIKLDFSIPETFLSAVALDQKIEATTAAYADRQFEGVVSAIDSRIDPVTRSVNVRAEIANPERLLKPGMLLTVRLISRSRMALAAPETALLQRSDRYFVFRIEAGNIVKKQPVKIGMRLSDRVEILDGLTLGDRVVIDGVHRVREDQTVKLVDPIPARDS